MQCHRFEKRYYGCKLLCDRCKAVRQWTNQHHDMTFKDFSPNPKYAASLESHDDYVASGRPLSYWSKVEGWQLETCVYDWMHMFLLGVGRSLVPSALKLIQQMGYHYEAGESDAEFLKRATVEMKQTLRAQRRRGLSELSEEFVSKKCVFVLRSSKEPIGCTYLAGSC